MTNIVLVGFKRSPFTIANKGLLAGVRPEDILSQVINDLIKTTNINKDDIEDIIAGCAYPEGEQGYNLGRLLTFLGDLPVSVPGTTINRLCGSSMQAVLSAAANIEVGWGDCFLVGGVESMSRIQRRGFNWSPSSELEEKFPDAYIGMGMTAENVAKQWKQTRLQHEEFALLSHKKASHAQSKGLFRNEIASIQSPDELITDDGCIRGNTTLESMAKLNPAFGEDGLVTAATSSPLTDGAVFMIVCSEDFAEKHSLNPLARIVAGAVTGCEPHIMGIGPIESTKEVLRRSNWGVEDVDLFELNEAFSSQSLAVINDLGINPEIVNLHGGALAIGHPLGASGARITGKAASLLHDTKSKRAVASMCIGGGMGISIALEKI